MKNVNFIYGQYVDILRNVKSKELERHHIRKILKLMKIRSKINFY